MLCRRYGATCAYTPMIHARLFVEDLKYRKEIFTTCLEAGAYTRPLQPCLTQENTLHAVNTP
jgi:hypothetical protein